MRALALLRRPEWRRWRLAGLGLLAVLLILLLLVTGMHRPPLTEVLPTGALRVGIDASNPPFAAAAPGGYTGFEVALSQAIADELGTPLALVGLGFDGLYDALAADQVDVVIAAVPIDVNRMAQVTYSDPYFNAGLVLVSNQSLMGMDDLPGKVLAFEYGSIAHAISNDWLRQVAAYRTLGVDGPAEALDAVRSGAADAALVDAVVLRLYMRATVGWKPNITAITDVLYAAVTRADRSELSRYVGEAMSRLMQEGAIEALLERWF